ncbi:MAG TPA: PilZ domain-containing protein [Kofleriaceae bacterium]|nr:PilZ domain-containing protein [Kofleriaceae bacterium]
MPKVLVSNNSELLRHLTTAPFRRLAIDLVVAASGDEVVESVQRDKPALAILDAELPVLSGYEATRRIKEAAPQCRVVLVLGKRINAEQMRKVAESRCDEVLIAPMTPDELYDVAAIQLGMPRRGAERFRLDLGVAGDDGVRQLDGRVTNLSVDGARLVVSEPLAEDTLLVLRVIHEQETTHEPLELTARVIWSQPRGERTIVGAAFEGVDEMTRHRLGRLIQWEVVEDTERTRVVIKGDVTEATSFADLMPIMVGRVDFDLSQVTYMNSLGVRAWVEFLREAPVQGYELHACSVPFIVQAALSDSVLGRGTVTSFFAPYVCERCNHEEERLLQSAAVLASDGQPPTFTCPGCGADLVLDDLPQRYLAFLHHGADDGA